MMKEVSSQLGIYGACMIVIANCLRHIKLTLKLLRLMVLLHKTKNSIEDLRLCGDLV
jgi:hypothetical protein